MTRVICKRCGGAHPIWECKAKNTRVYVRGDGVEGKGHAGAASEYSKVEAPQTLLPSGRAENTPGAPAVTAGAKSSAKPRSKKPKAPRALIEANILPAKPTPAVGSRSRRVGTEAGSSPVDTPKKFNKTAYMREYMRKRRAKLKEKD